MMRDAFDDFEFDEMTCHQAQGPARVPRRGLRAGKLGDARLDLPGDLDLSSRSGAGLALQGIKRPYLATAFTQALDGAYGQSGDLTDFQILQRRAMKPLVGEKQGHGSHGTGGLSALLIADGLEFVTLEFQ